MMNPRMPIYNQVYSKGDNIKAKVKSTVFLDLVKCALRHVKSSNPESPLYFSFEDDDLTLENDGKTLVANVHLTYSSQSDVRQIGNKVMEEVSESTKSAFPNIQFRIAVSGTRGSR